MKLRQNNAKPAMDLNCASRTDDAPINGQLPVPALEADNSKPVRRESARNANVEIARLAAAAGIVWFHFGSTGRYYAWVSLPLFVLLAITLPSYKETTLLAVARNRATRLLLPWLQWVILYGIFFSAIALKNGKPPFGWVRIEMLFYGTALHLWFLPALFVFNIVAWFLHRSIYSFSVATRYSILIGICIATSGGCILLNRAVVPTPFDMWIPLLPFIGLGMLLRELCFSVRDRKFIFVTGVLAVFAGTALTASGLLPGIFTLGLFAFGAAALVFSAPSWSTSCLDLAAPISFLVYLCHELVFQFLYFFLHQHSWSKDAIGLCTLFSSFLVATIVQLLSPRFLNWKIAKAP